MPIVCRHLLFRAGVAHDAARRRTAARAFDVVLNAQG